MVEITIEGARARFNVLGWDKLWAFTSQLDIPLEHIRSVRVDPEPARGWWHGLRMPGTQVPGVITAGTYYQKDGVVFYDVHNPDRTIVLELEHDTYKRLVVEVEHPEETVQMLNAAIARLPT